MRRRATGRSPFYGTTYSATRMRRAPSAVAVSIRCSEPRSLNVVNARRRPSGDHAGAWWLSSSRVSRTTSRPPASTTKSCDSRLSASNGEFVDATAAPHAVTRNGTTSSDRLTAGPLYPSSDRLELLERLAAARAVAHRPARRRSEDVLEPRVGRTAVRAAERRRLQVDEGGRRRPTRRRRSEPGRAQLLAALRRDPVGRPRVVCNHGDLRLGAE